MTTASLRLTDVACVRGGRMLLQGITLVLGPGESALLRGPNGAGKSSLIRLAAGLLPCFAGTVTRTGALALSDENMALDRDRSLAEALRFWAKIDGASRDTLDHALAATGLTALAGIPVRMLSTGQRKRAALARVVAARAAIWLLDEPANGLDAEGATLLGALMDDHLAKGGILLAASHQDLPLRATCAIDLRLHAPLDADA